MIQVTRQDGFRAQKLARALGYSVDIIFLKVGSAMPYFAAAHS
jgi:hypothetical protein